MAGRTNPALALHELAPDRELVLRGHVLQVLDPVAEKVLAGQGVERPLTQKDPAGHDRHVEALAVE